MIVINRSKAEAITWDRIRIERDAAITALDVHYMTALEQGTSTDEIVEQKQALRDVTAKDLSGLSLEQLTTLTLAAVLAL
jgi:hypothetical protein